MAKPKAKPPSTSTSAPDISDSAFQANLLSLISHELRTPLTGIMNALGVMEGGDTDAGMPREELVAMALRNARQLQATLATLLDHAAIESGAFRASLREVNFKRIALRVFGDSMSVFAARNLHPVFSALGENGDAQRAALLSPVLADPQKLARAIELMFHFVATHSTPRSDIQIRTGFWRMEVQFPLSAEALQAGISKEKFAGVAKNQNAFLSRTREGLGGELHLISELMKSQSGTLEDVEKKGLLTLSLSLARMPAKEALRTVLQSRVYETTSGLGSIALAYVKVPDRLSPESFQAQIKSCLFRATDAAYLVPEMGVMAIVLNDCKPEDAPKLLVRVERTLQRPLSYAHVTCPDEGTDPEFLMGLAERRLQNNH